jgi:hypothetical protein
MAGKRNDSSLYSGMTSESAARARAARKETSENKREKRKVLLPYEEFIISEINKEIHDLIYTPYEGEDLMSDMQFRSERRARRLAVEHLTKVRRRMTNIMRVPPEPVTQQEPEDDGFSEFADGEE